MKDADQRPVVHEHDVPEGAHWDGTAYICHSVRLEADTYEEAMRIGRDVIEAINIATNGIAGATQVDNHEALEAMATVAVGIKARLEGDAARKARDQ